MKKILVFLMIVVMMLVGGCAENSGGKHSDPSERSPTEGANWIAFGKKEDAKCLLQVDINPSVIVGYADNEEVVYVASNNADGYELLREHDAEKILGEPINAAIGSIMTAAHEDGYEAGNFDVSITFSGEEKGDPEDMFRIVRGAVETCDFDITVLAEGNEFIYSPESGISEISKQGESGTHVCGVCNGEGILFCEVCNGEGETIVIVQREKEVRNDYVCEVCGGEGMIDDGKHGGKKGNCDSCGGAEGKMPSADFREKAYDRVMVDEEEKRRCEQCDGSGTIACGECGGAGKLD